GAGPGAREGGGGGAGGEGGQGQGQGPGEGAVAACLAVGQPEAALAETEISLHRPAAARHAHQGGARAGPAGGHVAEKVGQVSGVVEAAADEQVAAGGGGGQPRPAVVPLSLGPAPGRSGLPG